MSSLSAAPPAWRRRIPSTATTCTACCPPIRATSASPRTGTGSGTSTSLSTATNQPGQTSHRLPAGRGPFLPLPQVGLGRHGRHGMELPRRRGGPQPDRGAIAMVLLYRLAEPHVERSVPRRRRADVLLPERSAPPGGVQRVLRLLLVIWSLSALSKRRTGGSGPVGPARLHPLDHATVGLRGGVPRVVRRRRSTKPSPGPNAGARGVRRRGAGRSRLLVGHRRRPGGGTGASRAGNQASSSPRCSAPPSRAPTFAAALAAAPLSASPVRVRTWGGDECRPPPTRATCCCHAADHRLVRYLLLAFPLALASSAEASRRGGASRHRIGACSSRSPSGVAPLFFVSRVYISAHLMPWSNGKISPGGLSPGRARTPTPGRGASRRGTRCGSRSRSRPGPC